MDIRSAKRPVGTQQATSITEEKPTNITPTFDADGTSTDISLDKYESVVIGQYMAFLKDNGISEEDIMGLLDRLITDGDVTYSTVVFGKIPAVFRVRPAWINDLILQKMDEVTGSSDKVSVMRFNNLIALYNLAASLIQYGDNRYDIDTEEAFDTALERIKRMPYIAQNALVNALSVFDRALAVATSDWAVKNFTKPLTDE